MRRHLSILAVTALFASFAAADAQACHKAKCPAPCPPPAPCVVVEPCPPPPPPVVCAPAPKHGFLKKCGGLNLNLGGLCKKPAPAPCPMPVAYGAPAPAYYAPAPVYATGQVHASGQ